VGRHDTGEVLTAAVWATPRAASAAWARLVASPEGVMELAVAARFHRIEGYLMEWVRSVGGHPALEALLKPRLESCVRAHMSAIAALRRLGSTLDEAGIDWAAFKGPVLAETAHGSPSRRSYQDLDVLVRRRDFRRAVDVLAGNGVRVLDTNTGHMLRLGAGQLHLQDPWGQNLDLHWGILYGQYMRDQFSFSEGQLLDRRRFVDVVGRQVPTFGPVDTLLHLALHSALEGAHRLVWLKDVERVLAREQLSWGEIIAAARVARLAAPLAAVLRRARAVTGAPVPGEVLRALVPRDLGLLDAMGVWVNSPARSSAQGSPARLIARAARGTPGETRRELLRRVVAVRPAALAGRPDGDGPPRRGLEAFEPDATGRPFTDYLAWVESGEPVSVLNGGRRRSWS
jgi:hypothetical protein